METQLENKTEVDLKKVENYLNSVSKHLYLSEDGKKFIKAFPITVNNKLYFVKLEFDGKTRNNASIVDVDYYVEHYGSNAKCVIEHIIFPPHGEKRSSITNFKAMREKVAEIKKLIEEKFDDNNRPEIQKEVSQLLVGLEPKIKE